MDESVFFVKYSYMAEFWNENLTNNTKALYLT